MADGLEALHQVSGLSKDEVKNIWLKIKENSKKLEACPKHDFSIDLEPNKKFNKKYQCTCCGGTVYDQAKYWYEKGFGHGSKVSEDIKEKAAMYDSLCK
jgi:hypothetical protein